MKQLILLFISGVILFTTTGCEADTNNQSEVILSESSVVEEQKVNEDVLAIDNLLGEAADRTVGRTNILKGNSYTPSQEAGSDGYYTDDEHKKLTDGISAESFNSYSWAGYTGSGTLSVTFDLGENVGNIADIEIGCLRQVDYGIGLPGYAEIYVSSDGENYTKLGKLFTPADVTVSQKYTYKFNLQGVVETRYLQIKLGSPEKLFIFVDEIAAYVYDGGGSNIVPVNDYYTAFTPESNAAFWNETESDYSKKQNLALGKKTSVVSFSALDTETANETLNCLPESGILTDGQYAVSASWELGELFRMSHGDGRQLIIDLEKISAVSSVSGDVLQQAEWGIRAPKAIGVSISENGADWQGVATIDLAIENDETIEMVKFTADFGKTYRARYVKLQFLINPHVAISEIEVIGTKKIPSNAISPDPDAEVTRLSDRFITPEDFGGLSNILCNPVCRGDGVTYDEAAMITHDEFLPYVGYYEDGILKDTFFDTFLFSPCSGYTNSADTTTLKGWKFYVDSQFVADRNLYALNEAVKTTGAGLEQNDLKVNIFFSILRTFPIMEDGSVNSFGDIDGDGVEDRFDTFANRKKAIKWMIDTQLEMYEAAGLDRLNLAGFYWQEEHIFLHDPQEVELVQWAAEYIHDLGYKIMWIPYYNATGFANWKEYGFDLTCLQPNYSFMSVVDEDRLDTTAYQAKMHGMCVELELSTYTNRANIERYKEYLEYGVKYGYMNAVKVYYLGIIPTDLTQALTSEDESTRAVYRDTYLFAKGLLDESYNQQTTETLTPPEGVSLTTQSVRPVSGKVEIGETGYRALVITVSPKYGTLRLNLDGSFTYTPMKNFTGTDSFCIAAEYATGMSENATVTVIIE